jgi:hypothetical protein
MGTFYTRCKIEKTVDRMKSAVIKLNLKILFCGISFSVGGFFYIA